MRWKGPATEIFFLVLALALEKSLKPSAELSVVLFAIAGVAGIALFANMVWNSDLVWKRAARKVEPHLARSGKTSTTEGYASNLVLAIDDILDELGTIDGHLTEAIEQGHYPFNFFLPSSSYHQHKAVISAHSGVGREQLSDVYVQADSLNKKIPRGSDGIEIGLVPKPDPAQLRQAVATAQATLRQLRQDA